jgi:predicted dehydrogenase
MPQNRPTRRKFLKTTAAVAAAPYILSAGMQMQKLGVAVIGVGGQGSGKLGAAVGERFVALVDIDDKKIAEVVAKVEAKVKDPVVFHDYRAMYDKLGKDLDAVLISTPDHNHAPAAIRAIDLGKHVLVEKPMTWCLYEARKLAETAAAKKVATQMANQGHSGEGYRKLCEYIWAGAIGNVTETHSLMTRNFGGSGGRPASKPIPEGVKWDLWLGPAAVREYHDGLHAFGWRNWCEFGTGTLGDMGCHILDGTFWALKIAEAKNFTIECLSQKGGSEEKFPTNNHLQWKVPARGTMPAVTCNSYDNEWPEKIKDLEKQFDEKLGGGTVYIGEKGIMATGTYGDNPRILPKEKHAEFKAPEKSIPRSKGGVIGDFFTACRGVKRPVRTSASAGHSPNSCSPASSPAAWVSARRSNGT